MCVGAVSSVLGTEEAQEPELISDQKPVEFSPPTRSYRSGRPRSCPNSWAKTPTAPFSGSIV